MKICNPCIFLLGEDEVLLTENDLKEYRAAAAEKISILHKNRPRNTNVQKKVVSKIRKPTQRPTKKNKENKNQIKRITLDPDEIATFINEVQTRPALWDFIDVN